MLRIKVYIFLSTQVSIKKYTDKMPKIVNKKKKQEEIILAAINTFYRRGIEQSSMKNIADSIEMGRSSLYSYFKNREEILNAMMHYTIHKFDKIIQTKLFNKTIPVSEKIVHMFTNMFYEDEQIAKLMSVVTEYLVSLRREGKNHDRCIEEFSEYISKSFSTLLQQGIEQGEFIHHDIEQMTYVLYALLESFILRGTIDIPIDENTIQMILNGITRPVREQEVII